MSNGITIEVFTNTGTNAPPVEVIEVQNNEQPIIVQTSDYYAPVQSVNGKIGFVNINKFDVGLSNVENISILATSGFLQSEINQFEASDVSQIEFNILSGAVDLLNNNTVFITGNQSISGLKTFFIKPVVNGSGVLLEGEIPTLPAEIVYTTGKQFINGEKTFLIQPGHSFAIDNLSQTSTNGWLYIDESLFSIGYNNNGFNIDNNGIDMVGKVTFDNEVIFQNVLRPIVNGSGVLLIGEAYPSNNPNGFITGVDLSSYATVENLITTGLTLQTNIDTVATNLASTGSTFNTQINNLSGYSDNTFATITNLATTGSNLQSQINNLDSVYATDASVTTVANNLATTGSTLQTNIDTVATNLASTGSTLNTRINSVSGYINSTNSNIIFTTGIQTIGGYKWFSGAGVIELAIGGYNINSNFLGYGPMLTVGGDMRLYNKQENSSLNWILGTTTSPAGAAAGPPGLLRSRSVSNFILDHNLANNTNLASTGQTLNTRINSLSGTLTSNYATITNLASTGSILNTQINNLSGSAVLIYGDQTIDGIKTFRNSVYIHDLYVTGAEFIANVENNFIESPYILLNLTGGAVDGGIFFVTGTGLTGVNDYGPIIGFDHSNKFKFGIARRSDDLSILNDIAAVQDITNYSGFVNNNYYGINNPSGFITGIDTSNFYTNNNPSGFITNANVVYTTGNQTISGIKIFATGIDIFNGTSPQNLRIFNTTGINSGEFAVFGWQQTGTTETPNALVIGTQATQSGILRDVILTGMDVHVRTSGITRISRNFPSTLFTNILEILRGTTSIVRVRDDGDLQANNFTVTTAGNAIMNNAGVAVQSTSRFGFSSDPTTAVLGTDADLRRDAADTIAQRRGTNAQQFRIYNATGTNSGEFATLGWSGNTFLIAPQSTQSGINRNLEIHAAGFGRRIIVTNNGHVGIGTSAGDQTAHGIWVNPAAGQTTITHNSSQVFVNNGGVSISDLFRFWSNTRALGFGLSQNSTTPAIRGLTGIIPRVQTCSSDGTIFGGLDAAQLRVYGTTGVSGNSGEFGFFGWITGSGISPTFVIGPQQTNSGILRDLTITGENINLASSGVIIPNPTVPTSTGSAGTRGQISWSDDFIYVCVSGNSWKRAALTTW